MELFVWNYDLTEQIPTVVLPATDDDIKSTANWQTQWTTPWIAQIPTKVALHRKDNTQLLGLMAYQLDENGLAVEIIYLESAAHSNANYLHQFGGQKEYIGIARALFAYAVDISMKAGFDGVVYFKAKTSELRTYYMKEFGASPLGTYDPFRLILWEDAAQKLLNEYKEGIGNE